jgi:hypothetical protein
LHPQPKRGYLPDEIDRHEGTRRNDNAYQADSQNKTLFGGFLQRAHETRRGTEHMCPIPISLIFPTAKSTLGTELTVSGTRTGNCSAHGDVRHFVPPKKRPRRQTAHCGHPNFEDLGD